MTDSPARKKSARRGTTDTSRLVEVGRDVGAVVQALRVLRALSDAREPLRLTEVARLAEISPSTTLNILRTLVNERVIAFDRLNKTYAMDLGILELARPLLNRTDLEQLRPHIRSIADHYGALVSVWRPNGQEKLLLVERVAPEVDVRLEMRLSTRLPIGAGAVGRAMLAASTTDSMNLLELHRAVRWTNAPTLDDYRDSIEAVGSKGYALDDGNLIGGVCSLAAVVTSARNEPVLGISAATLRGQLALDKLERLGRDLADLVSWARRCYFGGTDGR